MKTTTQTTVTANEMAVLIALRDSDYRDGSGNLAAPVWSSDVTVPAGMTRRGMGGVFASLAKKNLATLSGDGKDSTAALTPEGIALVTAPPPPAEGAVLTAAEARALQYGPDYEARHLADCARSFSAR
jgi:hypothetical protein